jgi:hypothetical protein
MNPATPTRYPITIDGETHPIGTAPELSVVLDVLQGQRDREVLEQLRPHLTHIIPQAKDFLAVMRSLSVEDQLYLIEALGTSLSGILQDARHLRDLLATMADAATEEALINALGQNGLRSLILTAGELAEVLEWVYGERDELVLKTLDLAYVKSLCRHANDLGSILRGIDLPLQENLLDYTGWEFVIGLVRDGRDLACLLRALPPKSSHRLLQHYSCQQINQLIGNAHDWAYLYQRLEPAEAAYITQLLELN